MRRILSVLLFAAALAAAPARSAREPLTSVPLEWRPTVARAELAVPPVDAAAFQRVRIRIDAFTDARGTDPASLAAPDAPAGPTTPGDVAAFVTDRFLALLGESGLPVVDDRVLRAMGADLVDKTATVSRVQGAVLGFSLAVGDRLDAEVRLQVSVLDGRGRGIWTGTSGGRSGRVARSFKVADAQAALSDALQEAIAQRLRTPDFVTALRGRR